MRSQNDGSGSNRGSVFWWTVIRNCSWAGEVKQDMYWQEQGVIRLTKTEIMNSPFQMFSQKYSKEKISLEIMLMRFWKWTLTITHQWTEPHARKTIVMYKPVIALWPGLGQSRGTLMRGWRLAEVKSQQSNTLTSYQLLKDFHQLLNQARNSSFYNFTVF